MKDAQAMTPQGNRLHLGCGTVAPAAWINVDGSWNAWLSNHRLLRGLLRRVRIVTPKDDAIAWPSNIVVHDVRRRLPFADGSMSAVYASHLLEHLYRDEARALLRECRRVLAPGGVLRLVVPDLESLVNEYLGRAAVGAPGEGPPFEHAADRLVHRMLMRSPSRPAGNLARRLYGGAKDFHSHKWMYDAASLIALVGEAGFTDARRHDYLDSRIPAIHEVERAEKVLNGEGICVEGVKPPAG
ncbi:MAG: methyltransferase domain-containing protein [SAR202 cluster bacterium]|nr:methyltransferase domain-containing protein [SAR202 cluster bacterium]